MIIRTKRRMGFKIARLRRRNVLSALLLVSLPYIFTIASSPGRSVEEALAGELALVQLKLQHLHMMHRDQQEDVRIISSQLQVEEVVQSAGGKPLPSNWTDRPSVRPLSTFRFLPHLLLDANSLSPAFFLSKGRSGVSLVMGVPTVRRQVQNYLLNTLENLLDGLSPEEKNDALIVVLVAETDKDYVRQVASEMKDRFAADLESGLIEVISPPPGYYPDLDKLETTFGDSPERVRWRTKQNLDYAFLMMYARPKGVLYLQLEDDILAKPGYLTTIKTAALGRIANRQSWLIIEFCQLGFIGKLFRCVELPWLVQYLITFHSVMPCDLLLRHFLKSRICRYEEHCQEELDKLSIHHNSLFQSVGIHSSLKGKVQELKDDEFGDVRLFSPHSNPEALVQSDIKPYQDHTLKRAYAGETFFWGKAPRSEDHLNFTFVKPIMLKRFLFRSGNLENPSDLFYNTTVEVLPEEPPTNLYDVFNCTADGYVILGRFDGKGLAEGKGDPRLGPIKELRLTLHSETEHWAILSEILIEAD